MKGEVVQTSGLLFDFIKTEESFKKLASTKNKNACHIIITKKLFATLNEDKRPHIRAAVFGFPSVISISGIVEGLALPKEFYLYKQKYTQLGIWEIKEKEVKKKFKSHFIDYQDKRMNEVLKGYISQALFFYIMGDPFCSKKFCRLYNAHWQEDLIYSQIKIGKFCPKHKKLLKQIKST